MNSSGIEAIIFDLDGVLVDGEGWHEEAFSRAMCDHGYEVSFDFKRKGFSTIQRLEELSKIGKAPSDFKSIAELKQKYTAEIIKSKCKPIDRITEAVKFAKEYTNGKIAVATNSSKFSAELMLELSGLRPFFDVVITREETGGKLKPHPRPYLEASYRLNIDVRQCLAIDDSWTGIVSAVDARCRTLKVDNFKQLSVDLIKRELKSLEIRI